MEKQNAKRTAAVTAAALGGAGSVLGTEYIAGKLSDEQNDNLQDENVYTADVTASGLPESEPVANELEEIPIVVEPEMIVTEPDKQEEQNDAIEIVEIVDSVNSVDSVVVIDDTEQTYLVDPPINPVENLDSVPTDEPIGPLPEMYGGPVVENSDELVCPDIMYGGPLGEDPDMLIWPDDLVDGLSGDMLSSELGLYE